MAIKVTGKMRERIDAGVAWLYTAQDGHQWYIDSTLELPCRQADFAEAMYDAWDGETFAPNFQSLSLCQLALEEGCPQWRGEGWYWIGSDGYYEPTWFSSLSDLKERVAVLRNNFAVFGKPWMANYGGSGSEAVKIF